MKTSKLLPTPTQDSATNRTKPYKQGGTPLTVAARLWPTPATRDHHAQGAGHNEKSRSSSLATVIQKKGEPTSPPPSAQLTLFAAGSRASRGAMPDSDEARKTTAISGRKCADSLARYSPLGSLAKTLLESSAWASTRCYLTWKHSATPANRLLFRLVPSMPRTDAIGSGLWRTPSHQDPGVKADRLVTKDGQPARIGARAYDKETGRLCQVSLKQQVMMPTPDANCWKSGERGTGTGGGEQLSNHYVAMLPTPRHGDGHKGTRTAEGAAKEVARNKGPDLSAVAGGSLNPEWVEALMGFPPGFTDIADED